MHWKTVALAGAMILAVGCELEVDPSRAPAWSGDMEADSQVSMDPDPTPPSSLDAECSVDADCGDHGVCDDKGGQAACRCALGFVAGDEGACVWDPGSLAFSFQREPDWNVTGGAVDAAGGSGGDPGALQFTLADLCEGARAVRSLSLDGYAASGPLVASLTYRYADASSSTDLRVQLGAADMVFSAPESTDWTTRSRCLGEGAYQSSTTLTIAGQQTNPDPEDFDCYSDSAVEIDSLVIRPAELGECDAPGTVTNADFSAEGHWSFYGQGTGGAAISSSAGLNESAAALLWSTQKCSDARVYQTVSIPRESLGDAAVELWMQGTEGRRLDVTLDGHRVGSLMGTGSGATYRACVPVPFRGEVAELGFALAPSSGGLCADSDLRSFAIDDVHFVTDPACAGDGIVDGGLEGAALGLATGWYLAPMDGDAWIVDDGTGTHSGDGAVALAVDQAYASSAARVAVEIPVASDGLGPAINYWYRKSPNDLSSFTVSATGPSAALTPAYVSAHVADGAWHQQSLCVDRSLGGQTISVGMQLYGGGGLGATTFSSEEVLIDDVSVSSSPACAP